jgi:hypothetical protein
VTATHPIYRTTATEAGADVNYNCPCGCDAGFAYNRSTADQAPESCCCGRQILVGERAHGRLQTALPDAAQYAFDVQTVAMPWGQSMEVALATPPDAEHGADAEHDHAGHDHDEHAH